MKNLKNQKNTFTLEEERVFFFTWDLLPPEQRLKFEKILEQENPIAFQDFKKNLLSKYTDKKD